MHTVIRRTKNTKCPPGKDTTGAVPHLGKVFRDLNQWHRSGGGYMGQSLSVIFNRISY